MVRGAVAVGIARHHLTIAVHNQRGMRRAAVPPDGHARHAIDVLVAADRLGGGDVAAGARRRRRTRILQDTIRNSDDPKTKPTPVHISRELTSGSAFFARCWGCARRSRPPSRGSSPSRGTRRAESPGTPGAHTPGASPSPCRHQRRRRLSTCRCGRGRSGRRRRRSRRWRGSRLAAAQSSHPARPEIRRQVLSNAHPKSSRH